MKHFETFELIVRIHTKTGDVFELKRLEDIGLARMSHSGAVEHLVNVANYATKDALRMAEENGVWKP